MVKQPAFGTCIKLVSQAPSGMEQNVLTEIVNVDLIRQLAESKSDDDAHLYIIECNDCDCDCDCIEDD